MTKRDLPALSIIDLRDFLRRREISPSETLQALEERINAVDPEISSYLVHDFATAMSEAKKADVSLPLGGIPIAIKDLINVEGQQCSCASKILRGYRAPYSATVIEKLRGHGAIPFGRMNMDEFAMGSSTENSSVQVTRNPWDLSRVPGGSSGGSAAAVAADIAFGALGTRRTVVNSRVQTQLRSSLALRSRGFRFFPRSDRTANENCTRLRFADECNCRPRFARFDFAQCAGPRLYQESWP